MKSLLFLVAFLASTSVFSGSRYDTYDPIINQKQEQKILELQRQLNQAELERQLEAIDRERAAREAADEAKREAEERAREAADEAKREAEERAREAAEQAEQAAAELRNAMIRSSVRTRNGFYLGGLLLLMATFVIYTTKNVKGGEFMDEDQKYGVVTMIFAFLSILLVLMISEGWNPQMDYLENMLNSLHIELIELQNKDYRPGEFFSSPYYHLIYWPSKYVVLTLLTVGAYGLTTYLGITGALRPWRNLLTK